MLNFPSLNALLSRKSKSQKKLYKPPRDLVKYNQYCHGWADFNLVYLPNHPKIVLRLIDYFHKYSLPYHVINDLDALIEFYPTIVNEIRIIWGDPEIFTFIEKGPHVTLAVTFDDLNDKPIIWGDLEVETWEKCSKEVIDHKFRSIYCFTADFQPA